MKTKDNIVTEGLSGRISQLVFRQRFGETVVTKRPRRKSGLPSAAQLNIQVMFKDAAVYAKAALSNLATKLAYKAKAKPGQSAFNMALADFFKAPVIGDIDISGYSAQAGSVIKIAASDDFKVASVLVRIESAGGILVEDGIATASGDGLHWLYTSTVSGNISGNTIIVTATDMPGHSIVKQKTI